MPSNTKSVVAPISVEEFNSLVDASIPLAEFFGIRAERIDRRVAVLRLRYSERLLREGGTHSGPSIMALIDLAMYAATLSIDRNLTGALTAQISVNFLLRPPSSDLLAECQILNVDEFLAVGRATVFTEHNPLDSICTSMATFAIPQNGMLEQR